MEIEFKGIPVKKVYYKGQVPKISNGYFKITNQSNSPTTTKVLEVNVSDGENKLPVNEYFVYKLPEYTELDPNHIIIGEKEEFQLDVSFSFIPVAGINKNKINVNMTIKVNDETIQSSSPVIIDFRIPKD